MVKRVLLVFLGCAACATVADLEVNRAPGNEPSIAEDRDDPNDASTTPPANEAGADSAAAEETGPPVFACACDAGVSCCVRSSSAPACDPASCTEPGSLLLGCVRPTTDGRDCCWNPDGGIARTTFGSGCDQSTAACLGNDDCAGYGGKCITLACKGVAIGVCASSAPSWFVCPP